jgi:hypothetical protein
MENAVKRFASRLPGTLPLFFSASALLLSLLSFRLTDVRNVKPVLTLTYENDSGWTLNNIGNGPALNVIVAERPGGGSWQQPVRVAPMAAGGRIPLRWLKQTNVKSLGASYTDIDGRRYSSLTSEDLTDINSENIFPKWNPADVRKQWEMEQQPR